MKISSNSSELQLSDAAKLTLKLNIQLQEKILSSLLLSLSISVPFHPSVFGIIASVVNHLLWCSNKFYPTKYIYVVIGVLCHWPCVAFT